MPTASRSRQKRPAKGAARGKRAAPALVSALAEAAWSEADAALAQAVAEYDGLVAARGAAARSDAQALLGQALARAARRRGLARFGAVGSIEAYDPKRHELSSAGRAPNRVRVKAQGVMRGSEILVKARVSAVRAKRR